MLRAWLRTRWCVFFTGPNFPVKGKFPFKEFVLLFFTKAKVRDSPNAPDLFFNFETQGGLELETGAGTQSVYFRKLLSSVEITDYK